MWRDLHHAARALAQAPTFTLTAAVTLALALGANGAIFGLVDALWFRPPGVRDPGTLVRVFATTPTERDAAWSWPEFQDIAARVSAFDDVAVRGRRGAILNAPDGSQELLLVNVVSTNFFEMLGVEPAAGRLFGAADDASLEASPSVVLGHVFWRTHFGGAPDIIGRTVRLGRGTSSTATVIGVLPATFRELEASADRDLWLPPQTWTRIGGDQGEFEQRDNRWFEMVARRRAEAPVRAAEEEVTRLSAALAVDYPSTSAGRGARVVDDLECRLERGGVGAQAMLALVFLIVLLTCANVANLLLSRMAARRQELAVRVALGASRWRLVREPLLESLLLGLLGAIGGVIVAGWLIRLLPALMPAPPGMRPMVAFQTDGRVVLFTAAAALVTTILLSLAPGWLAARADLVAVLRSAAGASPRDGRFKRGLVMAQLAISLVLLCVAADLARSFVAASRADLGFARKPVLALWTTFSSADHATTSEAVRQLEALPGVSGVALAIRAPLSLSGGGLARPVLVPGAPQGAAGSLPRVKFNAVSANYFEVLGTRIIRGRPFSVEEERTQAAVVISEQFARQFFAGREPIGSIIEVGGAPHRVIGIAQDAVVSEIGEPPQAYMYLPFKHGSYGETTFLAGTGADAAAVAAAARHALRGVDRRLEPRRMVTISQYVEYAASLSRATAALSSILALVGLVLTAVGVYGMVAYRTNRRTKEIGIRIALGAMDAEVLRLVMRDGLGLAVAGIAAGLPLALGATRLVASMLVGVRAWDALAFGGAAAVVLLVAAIATLVPARRASRLDPSSALRSVGN
jgi:predicted permease